MRGIHSEYKFFTATVQEREQSERGRHERYIEAHNAVTVAYEALAKAIAFDAYDIEDEYKLNDMRKRLFHFQRLTLERLHELREAPVVLEQEKALQKNHKLTWRDYYKQLGEGHTSDELKKKADEWREYYDDHYKSL